MADKPVTVEVPEDRVPEFYLWFAAFLASPPGSGPPRPWRGGPRRGGFGHRGHHQDRRPWGAGDLEDARWLYGRLSDPARELFDLLIDSPGERHSGNEIAARLEIDKGAHGLAGILAWPGRWCSKLGLEFPITTTARDDGGTDYAMQPELAPCSRAREAAAERAHVRGPGRPRTCPRCSGDADRVRVHRRRRRRIRRGRRGLAQRADRRGERVARGHDRVALSARGGSPRVEQRTQRGARRRERRPARSGVARRQRRGAGRTGVRRRSCASARRAARPRS